jgi:hypothetical protein
MPSPNADKNRVPKIFDTDGFRPFTEQEKQEFVNSLNGSGRRMLDELAGKASTDPENDDCFFGP